MKHSYTNTYTHDTHVCKEEHHTRRIPSVSWTKKKKKKKRNGKKKSTKPKGYIKTTAKREREVDWEWERESEKKERNVIHSYIRKCFLRIFMTTA